MTTPQSPRDALITFLAQDIRTCNRQQSMSDWLRIVSVAPAGGSLTPAARRQLARQLESASNEGAIAARRDFGVPTPEYIRMHLTFVERFSGNRSNKDELLNAAFTAGYVRMLGSDQLLKALAHAYYESSFPTRDIYSRVEFPSTVRTIAENFRLKDVQDLAIQNAEKDLHDGILYLPHSEGDFRFASTRDTYSRPTNYVWFCPELETRRTQGATLGSSFGEDGSKSRP